MNIIKGSARVLGDEVSTDIHCSSKYLPGKDTAFIATVAFDNVAPGFAKAFVKGDVIVAGANFGINSSREQAVLEALIARPGRVMSKEQLADQVFGLDEDASPDAIEIYVHRLRKKLEGDAVRIVTFRGLGYLLEAAGD